MKCDDNKVLAISYILTETLNHKELLKVIMLLISEYFRESEEKNGKKARLLEQESTL